MKTRERIKKIRQAEHWFEKRSIAGDVVPGTPLDMKLIAVCQAYERRKENPVFVVDAITDLGVELAKAIRTGDSALFRQWAVTIDSHKKHVPFPDKLRVAVLEICRPQTRIFERHWINEQLRKRGFDPDAEHVQRQVTRILRENHIKTDRKRGASITDTKARKLPR